MTKEEFQTDKFIYPFNDWQCFVCLKEVRQMEVFAEDGKQIYLICESCHKETAQSLLEIETFKIL